MVGRDKAHPEVCGRDTQESWPVPDTTTEAAAAVLTDRSNREVTVATHLRNNRRGWA